MRLAEAMPVEKYTWRPARGRSLGRRSLHPHYRGKLWHCRGTGYRPTSWLRFQGHHGPQRCRQAAKNVQPSDHPARILPHNHGTFWRAPRPIHRLRAHERDGAALDGKGPAATVKARGKTEAVGPRRIERSVSYTFTSTSTFRRSGGVQQLCTNANQIRVDIGGSLATSPHAQRCFHFRRAAVFGSGR